jgi:hypothetical protein
MVAKGEAWDDEFGYKENKAIPAMARASTRLCLTLTERAIESNRNDTFNLSLAEKCFAWEQERKNVTFLSIGIGMATRLLVTAFLYNSLIGTIH